MKKLLFAIASAMLFVSCSKKNDVAPPPSASKKLTKEVNVYDGGTPEINEFAYDAQGRLITITANNKISTFSYPDAGRITSEVRNKITNALTNTSEYTLDANGRITTVVYKSSTGTVTQTSEITYDAQGYVNKYTITYAGQAPYWFEYSVSNGNYTGRKQYENGNLVNTTTYTLDPARTHKSVFGVLNFFPTETLFGKHGKNPVVELKTVDAAGTTIWHSQSTFQFDTDGYAISSNTNFPLLGTQLNTVSTFK